MNDKTTVNFRLLSSIISICFILTIQVQGCKAPNETKSERSVVNDFEGPSDDKKGENTNLLSDQNDSSASTATQSELPVFIIAGEANAIGPIKATSYAPNAVDKRILFSSTWLSSENFAAAECATQNCATNLNSAAWTANNDPFDTVAPQANHIGPELIIGRRLVSDYYKNDEKIAFIKFAVGSSSIKRDWLQTSNNAHLKLRMIRHINSTLRAYRKAGLNPRIKALIWVQGATDRDASLGAAENYSDYLTKVVATARFQTAHPTIPIVLARININSSTDSAIKANINHISNEQGKWLTEDRIAAIINGDNLPRQSDNPTLYTADSITKLSYRLYSRVKNMIPIGETLDLVGRQYHTAMTKEYNTELSNSLYYPHSKSKKIVRNVDTTEGPITIAVELPEEKHVYDVPKIGTESAEVYIENAIKQARKLYPDGGLTVNFPKAAYSLDTNSPVSHIYLYNQSNMTINFNDSTLFLKKAAHGIVIDSGKKVFIKNVTLRHDFAIAITGVIRGSADWRYIQVDDEWREKLKELQALIGSNRFGTFFTGRADTDTMPRVSNATVIETSVLGTFKEGLAYNSSNGRMSCPPGSSVPDCKRIMHQDEWTSVVVLLQKNKGNGVLIIGETSHDISISNLKMSNISGCGIMSIGMDRGLYLTGIKIAPTSAQEFMGASACGIRTKNVPGDIIVENSTIIATGDDGMNIQGDTWIASKFTKDGDNYQVEIVSEVNKPVKIIGKTGDEFTLFDDTFRPWANGIIESVISEEREKAVITIKSTPELISLINMGLDKVVFGNLSRNPSRVYIVNNSIGVSRARGILLQSSNTYIANNNIWGHARPGIAVTSDLNFFYESAGACNVIIKNNWFTANNFWKPNSDAHEPFYGSLSVNSDLKYLKKDAFSSFPIFKNIRILDNTFNRSARSAISFASVLGGKVFGNKMTDIHKGLYQSTGSEQLYPSKGSITIIKSGGGTNVRVAPDEKDDSFRGVHRY